MALIYLDNIDACPIMPAPTVVAAAMYPFQPLYSSILRYTRKMNSGFSALIPSVVGANSVGTYVRAGTVSEKELCLQACSGNSSNSLLTNLNLVIGNSPVITVGAWACFDNPPAPNSAGAHAVPQVLAAFNAAVDLNSDTPASAYATRAVIINPNGSVSVNTATSSPGLVNVGVMSFIEMVITLATDTVSVYVNGTLAVTGTLSLANTITAFAFICSTHGRTTSNNNVLRLDNIYVLDNVGATFNARLGPIGVTRLPLDTEVATTWTPSNAVSNIVAVNKNDLSEASWVTSPATANQADTFTVDPGLVSMEGNVWLYQSPYFRNVVPGERDLGVFLSDGTNTIEQIVESATSEFVGPLDPLVWRTAADGTAWTLAKLIASRVGYRVKPS